ncbi:Calsyntenin-1 [Schistosoma japonicum]|nr:Calsyntenin-1 [Schistosoma japonicum]
MRYIKCTRLLRENCMKFHLVCISLFHLLVFGQCELSWNFPSSSTEVFHAYVNEKTHTIQVFPAIQVKLTNGSKLCSISLLASGRNNVPNFINANILDHQKGNGYLTFNETLYHASESFGSFEARTGFYHLRIIAEDCSNPPKSTTSWPITFEHIRSDLPIWSKTKYEFDIDSLHIPGYEVGKVTAYASTLNITDNNNNPLYGDDTGMCSYTIQDSSYSFAINGHGVIRSLIRFNNHTDSLYEFNVTGYDCHLPVPYSSTVPVKVYVKAICVSQWNGIPKEIAYSALSDPYPIASNAKFSICPQRNTYTTNGVSKDVNTYDDEIQEATMEYDYCPIEQVTIRMKILWSKEDIIIDDNNDQTIQSSSSSTGSSTSQCDLDHYSLLANRKTCIGSSRNKTIDLLPDISEQYRSNQQLNNYNHLNLPIIETIKGLNNLPKINTKCYPSGIYYFNGSTQFDLNQFNKFHKLHRFDNESFTINFWMKHSPTFNRQYENNLFNGRENILCSSDEYEKNRHHFAVFLHNCKLVVLIRREPNNESSISDSTQLIPSQWRFDVDEVCDSNWHHYSLTYHPPKLKSVNDQNEFTSGSESNIELQLYLDGQLVPNNAELVQIAENMPMVHLSSRNHEFVRTSVGACWHGRSAQFTQHFVGYLAGLIFTHGYIQSEEELLCLTNCEPHLFIDDPTFNLNNNRFDTTNIRNSHLNSIIIQAKNLHELSNILRKVTFYNPRLQYKPRNRPEPVAIQLNTMFTYSTDCEIPSIFNQVILISPLPPTKQTLGSLDKFNSNIQMNHQLGTRFSQHHHPYFQPQQPQQQQQLNPPEYEQKHQEKLPEKLATIDSSKSIEPNQSLQTNNFDRILTSSPTISLILFNTEYNENMNKTFTMKNITFDKLSSGVYIFPDITLMWKTSPELLKFHDASSEFEQTITSCTIELCKSESVNKITLTISEFILLNPDYLKNGINAFQHFNGFIIHGSSGILSYMNALKHVQWLSKDENNNINKRCFNVSCEAMVQIIEGDKLVMRKIYSNSIQSEFNVYRGKSTHSPSFISPIEQHYSTRLPLKPKPRIVNKRDISDFQLIKKSENETDGWNKGILLLISSSVLAVLVLLFVAIKRISRVHLKSNQLNSQTQNLHMLPCDIDALKQIYGNQQMNEFQNGRMLRNSKSIKHNSPIIVHHQQENELNHQLLRVTPNPIINQSDMKEYESKTILLDEKRYDVNLNMASSKLMSPIVTNPRIEFYENPLRSDQEDDDDLQCSCSEHDADDENFKN